MRTLESVVKELIEGFQSGKIVMKRDEELTLEEYCEKYGDIIYVRSRNATGKWGSYKLTELPPAEHARILDKWKANLQYGKNWRPARLLES